MAPSRGGVESAALSVRFRRFIRPPYRSARKVHRFGWYDAVLIRALQWRGRREPLERFWVVEPCLGVTSTTLCGAACEWFG